MKNKNKLTVMTILGTRPEIIRLSRVIAELDKSVRHVLVHTGQNYDYELNEVFFQELALRKPDYFLGVDASSLGKVLGNILIEIEDLLISEQPDAVLVLGDTNSSIAALMAKRLKIPVYHMEAGNRCFDPNVPEETNRKLVDGLSDFNLVYTEHARRNLLNEGFAARRIYLTGSPMNEVLSHYQDGIESSTILSDLKLTSGKYFLVSAHREENVDSKRGLGKILSTLNALATKYDYPIIVSTHPRTRKRIDELSGTEINSKIQFAKPFGFFAYNNLQKNAFCVLSDSGTISEESAILGFPAITIRDSIERPEAMDTGTIVVTGLNSDTILNAVSIVTGQYAAGNVPPIPVDYQHKNVSQRVLNLIVGTAKLSRIWSGLRIHDYDRVDANNDT